MDTETLAAYLDVIDSTVTMLVNRANDRELVALEDKLATLCGFVQVARFAAEDPYREERGHGVDGDHHARF